MSPKQVRHQRKANRHSQAIAKRHRQGPRPRRLQLELLEDRRMLAATPLLVDLQPSSDSGALADDNLTNVRTAVIDITAAQAGDVTRIRTN